MALINRFVKRLPLSQRGQGMIEYSLILVLVSIVVIVILLTMGKQVTNAFTNVARALGFICTQGTCR